MNKFSIITPVKNNKKGILKTILSVSSQKYKNYEHIIIDGNSNDGTDLIIKKKKIKKIIYSKIKDKNSYEAINKGLKVSKGNYIIILNSGDIFFNNDVLEKINNILIKNKFDVMIGNIAYLKKKNIVRVWRKPFSHFNLFNFYKAPHTGMFISKKTYNNLKFYSEDYSISSDTDLILRIAKNKKLKISYFDKFVVIMEFGGMSTSKKFLLKKVYQDMQILFNFFSIAFVFFYLLKILSKLSSFKKVNLKNFKKNK